MRAQPMATTRMPRNRGSSTACTRSSTPSRSSGIPPHTPKQHTTFEAVQAGEQILNELGREHRARPGGSRILQPLSGQHPPAAEGRLQRRRRILRHRTA